MSTTLTVYCKASQPIAWGALSLALSIQGATETQQGLTIKLEQSQNEQGLACLLESDGSSCKTVAAAIKSLAQAFADQGIVGKDKQDSDQVERWLQFAQERVYGVTEFTKISAAADELDSYLTLRSFIVGHKPSAADFAIWGAIKGNIPLLGILKKGQHTYLNRYYLYIDSLPPTQQAIADFNAAQKAKAKSKGPSAAFELGLPNAVHGQVVTRFPPEPSGYLHIGHSKAALLNQHFARQYNGKLIVRFDDTNPSKEKAEFQDAILEDLAMMGIKHDKMSYTSDYFDQLFQQAVSMIKSGNAYADDTAQEQMRAERMDGIASKNRDASIEDNLARFADMQSGSEEGQRWCLRAKISVDDPNKAMRDPVIYRCNPEPHHRTGTTWKIYPGYDFACPVVDALEGVTHALRSNEYRDRNPQYAWMLKAMGLRHVEIWDFSRANFVYTLLSKRKLKAMVESGLVSGWDDPRFATIRGIRRRGMTVEGLNQFMLAQGPSQNDVSMDWDGIWSTNKKVIDPIAPRHAAVLKEDLVKVNIKGSPKETYTQAIPKHKKNLDIGNKTTTYGSAICIEQEDAMSFADGEEITLMDWGNAFIRAKHMKGDKVDSIDAELHLEGDFKKTSKKVHWLSESSSAPLIKAILLDYDYLITKKKLEEDDDWSDFVNPKSEYRQEALADHNVTALKQGDIIQFERKGYYIVDRAYNEGGKDGMDFILIPDGRAASIQLKATPPALPKATNPKSTAHTASVPLTRLPTPAPAVSTETILQTADFNIPVTTKMFHVEKPTTEDEAGFPAKTGMYNIPSVYKQSA